MYEIHAVNYFMRSCHAWYLTSTFPPESLDLTFWAFDAFVPVDAFEDLKVGTKGAPGRRGARPESTDWIYTKNNGYVWSSAQTITSKRFSRAAIYIYPLYYVFAVSMQWEEIDHLIVLWPCHNGCNEQQYKWHSFLGILLLYPLAMTTSVNTYQRVLSASFAKISNWNIKTSKQDIVRKKHNWKGARKIINVRVQVEV